jgi:hypothetical protein
LDGFSDENRLETITLELKELNIFMSGKIKDKPIIIPKRTKMLKITIKKRGNFNLGLGPGSSSI